MYLESVIDKLVTNAKTSFFLKGSLHIVNCLYCDNPSGSVTEEQERDFVAHEFFAEYVHFHCQNPAHKNMVH